MTPFLAYLARRKYELHQTISNEHPHSPFLSKFQGALEELTAIIGQLPEWERDIVEKLFEGLQEFYAKKEEIKNEISIH